MPTSAQDEQELRAAAAAMSVLQKRHFPTFALVVQEAARLAKSDKLLLTSTAFLMVAITWCAGVADWFLDSPSLGPLRIYPYWVWTCVALAGGWSTLGAGRWHLGFPLACLVGLWLLAADFHVAELDTSISYYGADMFAAQAVASFVLGAFATAWIRSIWRVEFSRRASAVAQPSNENAGCLRSHQFNLRVMFVAILLAAIVLSLIQAPSTLWPALAHVPRELGSNDRWWRAPALVAAAIAAALVCARSWRLILVTAAAAAGVMVAIPLLVGTINGGSSREWRALVFTAVWWGGPSAVTLVSAMIPIVCLRAWGFQLRRIPDSPSAASTA
jgi:hypothetical protein